jgi:hypothetical protein
MGVNRVEGEGVRGPRRELYLTAQRQGSLRLMAKVDNLFDREYFENGFHTPGPGITHPLPQVVLTIS